MFFAAFFYKILSLILKYGVVIAAKSISLCLSTKLQLPKAVYNYMDPSTLIKIPSQRRGNFIRRLTDEKICWIMDAFCFQGQMVLKGTSD